jgi:FG-GAP-like repeat
LNGDTHADIVVADSKNNSIIIFLGTGNGTFVNNLTFSMGLQSSPTSIAITNLNNDKWVDLVVVVNRDSNNLSYNII